MSAREQASTTAAELQRTALLAKLAVDLGDPPLARRAARYAQSSARLLAGSDFPPHVDDDCDDCDHDHDHDHQSLPEVDDLLERLPNRAEVEL
jgi:hypothetical protein